jgi:8-oxo-dGTP pyrophosphatase MutT (NUDIX family)
LAARLRRCLDQNPYPFTAPSGRAAVLIALTDEPAPELLLIRRGLHLTLHPGEIALPGGKAEAEDADLLATAQREAWEEVRLPPSSFEYCGSLAPRITLTGLDVVAMVGVVPPGLPLRADPGEVDEIIAVPLAHFAAAEHLRVDWIWRRGGHRAIARYHYTRPGQPEQMVWGMTGSFIVELVNRFYDARLEPAILAPFDTAERGR